MKILEKRDFYRDYNIWIFAGASLGEAKLGRDSKPPLPKVHSTPKKPSTPRVAEGARRSTEKLSRSVRASPRVTPLQSPAVENVAFVREVAETTVKTVKVEEKVPEAIPKVEDKNEEQPEEVTQVTFLYQNKTSKNDSIELFKLK